MLDELDVKGLGLSDVVELVVVVEMDFKSEGVLSDYFLFVHLWRQFFVVMEAYVI